MDKSVKTPCGVIEDVIFRVGKFVFPIDFLVIDTGCADVSLILGRPFLNTSKAVIDVFEGKLTLRVGKEEATFQLIHGMKYSDDRDDDKFDDSVHMASVCTINDFVYKDALDSSLRNFMQQEDELFATRIFIRRGKCCCF